jgi:coproporphyrinogen III oxidase
MFRRRLFNFARRKYESFSQRTIQISSIRRFGKFGIGVSGGLAAAGYLTDVRQKTVDSGRLDFVSAIGSTMAEPITPVERLLTTPNKMTTKMELFILDMQAKICHALEEVGQDKFRVDRWLREDGGGGGITCIIQDGDVFEKAGVNISVVHGELGAAAVKAMKSRHKEIAEGNVTFFAAGISSVIHPRNPNVPTVHFNYRYFEVVDNDGKKTSWFGGGTDLTPYILFEDDVIHFHKTLKDACDKHDSSYYLRFKQWCDKYFYIDHRDECRGVGGIFFDDLESATDGEDMFAFIKTCAESVLPSYLPLVKKHKDDGYSYDDRQWQLIRRGRYVEFNVMYDRGTKFGLLTPNARIESILMSLPLYAKWVYDFKPEAGTREAKLTEILKNPKDWI